MDLPPPAPRAPRWLVWAVGSAAALGGAKLGFDFGLRLAGWPLGVVTALNCGVMFALVAASLVDRLACWRRP